MAKTLGAVALVATALLATAPAHANLVNNGEFKADGAGWTFTGSQWNGGAFGVLGTTPGVISQAIGGLVSGQLYSFSAFLGVFNLGGSLSPDTSIVVKLGSQILGNFNSASLPQSPYTTTFVADGGSLLTFTGQSGGQSVALTVDDVSITAVPGPLAGAGLPVVAGMIAYGAWRRRKQAA